jgi:hypothetical protein
MYDRGIKYINHKNYVGKKGSDREKKKNWKRAFSTDWDREKILPIRYML